MKQLLVTVLRCKESKQVIDGKEETYYYSKLHHVTKDELLGKEVTQHLYVKGKVMLKENAVITLPMDRYYIQEHESTWTVEATGEVLNGKLKWLHLRSDVRAAMEN